MHPPKTQAQKALVLKHGWMLQALLVHTLPTSRNPTAPLQLHQHAPFMAHQPYSCCCMWVLKGVQCTWRTCFCYAQEQALHHQPCPVLDGCCSSGHDTPCDSHTTVPPAGTKLHCQKGGGYVSRTIPQVEGTCRGATACQLIAGPARLVCFQVDKDLSKICVLWHE